MALARSPQNRFTPHPKPPKGIALCLSGGGFRAALFHLGALRRLNELGILHEIDTITSVSGGSTIAAFLAYRNDVWNHAGGCSTEDWEENISRPFREFASRNFSTPYVLWGYLFPLTNVGVNSFGRACTRELYPSSAALPAKPEFRFCATELVKGVPYTLDAEAKESVGKAVAISSAFPLIFWPYGTKRPLTRFVDGGVADNRGLEPVWQTHHTVLVSDGGDVLRPSWTRSLTWSLWRCVTVGMNQMNEMQKRWLVTLWRSTQLQGTYWSIGGATENYPRNPAFHPQGYAADVALKSIAPIRLKYDAFTEAEAAILENHGYTLADMAIKTHARHLPRIRRPLSVPHPRWLNDRMACEALRNSSSSSLGGHGWVQACVRAIWRNLRKQMGGDTWKLSPPVLHAPAAVPAPAHPQAQAAPVAAPRPLPAPQPPVTPQAAPAPGQPPQQPVTPSTGASVAGP